MRRLTPTSLCALLAGATLAGCGSDEGSQTEPVDLGSSTPEYSTVDSVPITNTLTVERGGGGGGSFTASGSEVSCAGGRIRIGTQSIAPVRPDEPFFLLEAVVRDVSGEGPEGAAGATVELPTKYVAGPRGARLFVYDAETGTDLLSTAPDTGGSITFESVSCDPPSAEVVIDAQLTDSAPAAGGELSHVEGTLDVGG